MDAQVAEMRMQMQSAKSGGLPADAPEEVRRRSWRPSRRFMHFVDRESGTSVGIAFCETEEDDASAPTPRSIRCRRTRVAGAGRVPRSSSSPWTSIQRSRP